MLKLEKATGKRQFKKEEDIEEFNPEIEKELRKGKEWKRHSYGSTLGIKDRPKEHSLYCIKDENSGLAKIAVDHLTTGREVYKIVCPIEKSDLHIKDAAKYYRGNITKCKYFKGVVEKIQTDVKVENKRFSIDEELEIINSQPVLDIESNRRNVAVNAFYILANKHLADPKIKIKVSKGYKVTLIFSSPTLSKGNHRIDCDCLNNNYKYYFNETLKYTTTDLRKIFE